MDGGDQELQERGLGGFIDDDHIEEAWGEGVGRILAGLDGWVLEDALGRAGGQGRALEDDFAELVFAVFAVKEGAEGLGGVGPGGGM
jgi:hypothetical protein